MIHHPDAGSRYTAIRYGGALASIGDSHDNATAESLIGLYKSECVRRDGPLRTVEDLELVTASWVHWCSTSRLHSMIGNITPVEYEQNHDAHQPARLRGTRGIPEPPLKPGRFRCPDAPTPPRCGCDHRHAEPPSNADGPHRRGPQRRTPCGAVEQDADGRGEPVPARTRPSEPPTPDRAERCAEAPAVGNDTDTLIEVLSDPADGPEDAPARSPRPSTP
ncbi:integrase core domain-containing protein [Pseudonocardia abyssalis]|uniref:Transposase n=1 Tax=Pseudonocardia abyssalis TaxID=2792008 RepID=A0ABS6UT31_9PSEU|nr:integrase core domain-containing protein [Pseudonocardia abyssalis]MBW0113887.1 transposase [Pseudonocardia abyssalis]MBW0135116.1 transposase [Pseudonocardia abyssalis]